MLLRGAIRRVANLLERVLVIGGSGQLGHEIRATFAGTQLSAPSHADLDIESPSAVSAAFERVRPTLVINLAAFHQVERCEEFPERAFAVNALAVDRLAGASALAGAAFVTLSSDYVFDGEAGRAYREDDAANPLSAYGASKLAGEHLTRRHGERHYIVRTSGVYGGSSAAKGATFVDRVLAQAAAGETVRVVDDITFSPSYARDVASAVHNIVRHGPFGTYHLTNAGSTTWYAFAAEAFAIRGVRPREFVAISSADTGGVARRPRYSALAHTALEAAGLPPMRPWRDALRAYLETTTNN